MSVADLVAIILSVSSLVAALSILYAKFVKPVQKVVKQVEENAKQIIWLEDKITKIKAERAEEIAFDTEVRSVLIESLIAIMDGLEQVGANHSVTEQKKKLISFMSKQVSGK